MNPHRRTVFAWLAAWLLAAVVFSLWPQIDLTVARAFWTPEGLFAGGHSAVLTFIHRFLIDLSWIIVAGGLAWLLFASSVPSLRRTGRRGAVVFILLTLVAGPGGLGKATKDNWGRARPNQIQEFGGSKRFTPALVHTDQCERNCSFISGHASFAFWFGALALAFGRRRLAWALALGVGVPVGLMRIAQGGHFLSDVVFAALAVISLNLLLYHWLRQPLGLAPPSPDQESNS